MIKLKTVGSTTRSAQECAGAIFEFIKDTQAQLVAPYANEVKARVANDQERLQKAKDHQAGADNFLGGMGATYLSTRDETRYLLNEIAALNTVISTTRSGSTRIIAPVYSSETPTTPKKHIALTAEILGGFFLGLLLALGREAYLKLRLPMVGSG